MPEADTDKFRVSPDLSRGMVKPVYPAHAIPRTTDDEAYQFRQPNSAYENGSMIHELPDGLQTDGTQPRHWGDVNKGKG